MTIDWAQLGYDVIVQSPWAVTLYLTLRRELRGKLRSLDKRVKVLEGEPAE